MRSTLHRFRHVFGIRSAVVVVALLFTETVAEVLLDLVPGGRVGEVLWLAFLAGCALAVFRRWDRRYNDALNADHVGQPGSSKLHARRGVVAVIGLDSDRPGGPLAKLLREAHQLEYLALIGTPETAAANVADHIRDVLLPASGRHLPATHVRVWEHGNSQSIADFEQATTEALRWMARFGVDEGDVVVDISDGRRPMGYGAMVAADAADVEVQYLANVWDHAANAPIKDRAEFKVVVERYDDGVGRSDATVAR